MNHPLASVKTSGRVEGPQADNCVKTGKTWVAQPESPSFGEAMRNATPIIPKQTLSILLVIYHLL